MGYIGLGAEDTFFGIWDAGFTLKEADLVPVWTICCRSRCPNCVKVLATILTKS